MFPPNSEYVFVAALLALYVVLRLNVFSQLSRRLNPRTFLLVLFCGVVLLNVHAYRNKVAAGYGNDFVSPTEKALEELRKSLPNVRCVGFISDIPKSRFSDRVNERFVVRYAMAPVIVDEGLAADWIIVSLATSDPKLVPPDLVLVRDFGSGIMLFRKRVVE